MEGDRYLFKRQLGSGFFGQVWEAVDRESNTLVAIKLLPKLQLRNINADQVLREVILHAGLDHPNVIEFRGAYLTDSSLNIVMERANQGSLADFMAKRDALIPDGKFKLKFKEDRARSIFQQVVVAVNYCHNKGVFNRDLKLNNTLLHWDDGPTKEWKVKICDFGYSKSVDCSIPTSSVGTFTYMPPEVLQSGHVTPYSGAMADMYSLGVLLYLLLCGKDQYPFGCVHLLAMDDPNFYRDMELKKRELARRVKAGDYPQPEGVSDACREVIRRLLRYRPEERMTMQELLQHEFFLKDLPAALAERLRADSAAKEQGWPAGRQGKDELAALVFTAVPT